MIAWLDINQQRVSLESDGTWVCPSNSVLAKVLNSSFGRNVYPDSPSMPSSAYLQVDAVEKAFGVRANWSGIVRDGDEDRVY